MGNKLKSIYFLFGSDKETPNNKRGENQTLLNSNAQLLTPQDLELKRSMILNRTNNDPDIEQDFRRTCALYEEQKSISNGELKRAYQEYIDAYHQLTSIYIWEDATKAFLDVFDTENESNQIITLSAPASPSRGACIAKLPNRELFCYGDKINSGITLIIDKDYKTLVLPSGMPCRYASAIYFNKTVYCFGGMDKHYNYLALSSRFDLNENRWVKLTPMPIHEKGCNSLIFDRNILISGYFSKNLLIYSIDINSFSAISYEFLENTRKLLIKAERLYLIECNKNGFVYESEAQNKYGWKQIVKSLIGYNFQAYCLYNKDKIYIRTDGGMLNYYKFDLSKNEMFKL